METIVRTTENRNTWHLKTNNCFLEYFISFWNIENEIFGAGSFLQYHLLELHVFVLTYIGYFELFLNLVKTFGIWWTRFLQFFQVFDDNVVEWRVTVAHLAHDEPETEKFLFIEFLWTEVSRKRNIFESINFNGLFFVLSLFWLNNYLYASSVVFDVWIFRNFWHNFCSGNEVPGNLIKECSRFRFHWLNFGQSVLLNGDTKIVAILNFRNQKRNPHFQEVRILDQCANNWLHDFDDVAYGYIAVDRSRWQCQYFGATRCNRHINRAGWTWLNTQSLIGWSAIIVAFCIANVIQRNHIGNWNVESLRPMKWFCKN